MKYFALLAVAIVVCVDATGHIVNTGSSSVSRSDDGHGNYAFAYKEDHASGGTTRQEKGGKGYAAGSYTLRDHDGRQRVVNYVADAHGFRADIKTNEPGVDSKEDPADVSINGGKLIAIAEPLAKLSYGYAEPVAKLSYGYAEPEGLGWNRGYGGLGYGGPSGSYGVDIKHASLAEPRVVVSHGYGALGGYGKW